jgi:hypothetical protein
MESREDPMKIMALRALTSPVSTPSLPQHRPPRAGHRHVVAAAGKRHTT